MAGVFVLEVLEIGWQRNPARRLAVLCCLIWAFRFAQSILHRTRQTAISTAKQSAVKSLRAAGTIERLGETKNMAGAPSSLRSKCFVNFVWQKVWMYLQKWQTMSRLTGKILHSFGLGRFSRCAYRVTAKQSRRLIIGTGGCPKVHNLQDCRQASIVRFIRAFFLGGGHNAATDR